jgi:cell division protease FtsH
VKQQTKTLLVWLGLIVAVLALANMFNTSHETVDISYAKFVDTVEKDVGDLKRAENVTIAVHESYVDISYLLDGKSYQATGPAAENLYDKLSEKGIDYKVEPEEDGALLQFALMWLPMIFIVVLMVMFMRQMQAGGGRAMNFGKSKARLLNEHQNKVTFKDVAGVEEAREDVEEIIDFLRDTRKYLRVGGRIPKGVLLMGPPGTGKTLLARAIAGEAGVAFFSDQRLGLRRDVRRRRREPRARPVRAGQEERAVHHLHRRDRRGRSPPRHRPGRRSRRARADAQPAPRRDGRVREQRRRHHRRGDEPARRARPGAPAPGRFDRRIVVGLPDVRGREAILNVHTRKVPMSTAVDLEVARGTPASRAPTSRTWSTRRR